MLSLTLYDVLVREPFEQTLKIVCGWTRTIRTYGVAGAGRKALQAHAATSPPTVDQDAGGRQDDGLGEVVDIQEGGSIPNTAMRSLPLVVTPMHSRTSDGIEHIIID